jgi:hypothetical protein
MSTHSKYYGVGRIVMLRSNPKQTGRVVGASHSQDRYLVMWNWNNDNREQGLHSRMDLLPMEKS